MSEAIRRHLAACNGGPGLTADELAERMGAPTADVRAELAKVVLGPGSGVTCVAETKRAEGRYVLGDSAALRRVSA
jgi:hypothetical protein